MYSGAAYRRTRVLRSDRALRNKGSQAASNPELRLLQHAAGRLARRPTIVVWLFGRFAQRPVHGHTWGSQRDLF